MTSPADDRRRTFLRGLVVAVLVGVFLASTGAFGSAGAPYLERLAYWVLMMILGGLWGHLCSGLVTRFIDVDDRPWLTIGLMTAVITGPLSANDSSTSQTLPPTVSIAKIRHHVPNPKSMLPRWPNRLRNAGNNARHVISLTCAMVSSGASQVRAASGPHSSNRRS